MRRLICLASLLVTLALHGCATVPPPDYKALPDEEWPTGLGTIPPSWYDYNPELRHWYSPWYHNPYIAK